MKKLIFSAIVGVVSFATFAQDVHFSSMDFSPLTLNPAMAGANYDLQANVNYRTQWNSVAAPFQTIAASADMRLNANKRNTAGHLAVGINFFNDRAGQERISTNNVNISLAYHLKMNQSNTIGLGIYSGLGQRSFDPNGGMWGSQYNGMSYDASLSSNETFNNASFSMFDAGAGLVYTYSEGESRMRSNDGLKINAGFAAYHVNRPNYSFINDGEERLYMRFSAFANASIGIGNTNTFLEPAIYAQFQGPALEVLMGTDYRILINEGSKRTGNVKRTSIAIGGYYRNQDAIVARISMSYDGLTGGFAYDFNVSSLAVVSNARGGAEFFLRWTMENPFSATRARI
jgi:type IX secretion system PorP/SprF family membrane protein